MNHCFRKRGGFTLIELMLAMTFLSIMLIAIAMTVIQISSIYTRGETLRQVNQASRAVAADIQHTFADMSSTSLKTVVAADGTLRRMCTGEYTYAWNSAKYPENQSGTAPNIKQVRLARFVDPDGLYCQAATPQTADKNAQTHIPADYVELLQDGDRSLTIHELSVHGRDKVGPSNQDIFVVSMLLGTDSTDMIDTAGQNCKPPSAEGSNMSYCAINKIDFAARAGVR